MSEGKPSQSLTIFQSVENEEEQVLINNKWQWKNDWSHLYTEVGLELCNLELLLIGSLFILVLSLLSCLVQATYTVWYISFLNF